jgi:hypothetical protein
MLRVLGLSTAWQYMVYGAAIAAGLVISGDRIAGVVGAVLQRDRVRAFIGAGDDDGRREVLDQRAASVR